MARKIMNACLMTAFVLILIFTFLISIFFSYNAVVSHVIGSALWGLIYFIIPLAVFISLVMRKKLPILPWICLAAYMLIATGTHFAAHEYIRVFTPEKWAKYMDERHLMLDDFAENYTVDMLTRQDVDMLLGEPNYITDEHFNYIIERGYIDPVVLQIRFDENNVVEECFTYVEFETSKRKIIVP